jgi:hypothetical protein
LVQEKERAKSERSGELLTPVRAVAYGGLTVGFLDGLDAVIFFGLRGVSPERIFQSIASGLLGRAAYQGGLPTVVLGVLLHFTIALAIVTIYHLVSRRVPGLARRPFVWGPLYGITVYLTMNLVVLPLSAAVTGPRSPLVVVNGLFIHIIGVGIPSALFARAAQAPTVSRRRG